MARIKLLFRLSGNDVSDLVKEVPGAIISSVVQQSTGDVALGSKMNGVYKNGDHIRNLMYLEDHDAIPTTIFVGWVVIQSSVCFFTTNFSSRS